jgi:hypothetical protein
VRRNTADAYRIFAVTVTDPGIVSFSGLTISNGAATASNNLGGGVWNSSTGTVNLSNCAVTGNSADTGGGISNSTGTVNIAGCTVSSNSTIGSAAGVFNDGGRVNVTNSTVSDNFAGINGGGIHNNSGGIVMVTNCTVSGNSALGSGGAAVGGGLYNQAGEITVKSSIVALNKVVTAGPDVIGDFISAGFNLIGKRDGSTGFTAATDQTGTIASPLDPMLDTAGLHENGGPTRTIAILVGSPAIDKGTSTGLTGNLPTDLRGAGFSRTFDDPSIANASGGDGTDIGAFELQMPSPAPTPTPSPTKLANISTRAFVQTGDNVMIGGFIIVGTDPQKVIVRAIGPSLPVSGALADPTLELHDGNGALLETNDNWVDSANKQAIIDSTIPPSNDLESAIVRTLPPGNYTAIVAGVNDTTGVALVEVYALN